MHYQNDMTKRFRDALIEKLAARDLSWRAVAEGAGVSYEQLKKIKQRSSATTNIDDAVRVANFFGLTLAEFLDDQTAEDRERVAALYSQLTEPEREILRAAARGRSVLAREEGQ